MLKKKDRIDLATKKAISQDLPNRPIMKMIIAVIQPTKLRAVKEALEKSAVERLTICDAMEFARADGQVPIYRGIPNRTDVHRKITLEIAVNDDYVDATVETILQVAKTGKRGNDGDGKVFVLPIHEAILFPPETRGPGAI